MANQYLELKKRHQAEVDAFPMAFAFSNEQLIKALEKLNATKEECVSIYGGGIIKKTDQVKLREMFAHQAEEKNIAIENDKTGEGYIKDMFEYELANHEYNYTMDASDTLECLGLTVDQISKSQQLMKGFQLAGGSYL